MVASDKRLKKKKNGKEKYSKKGLGKDWLCVNYGV